MSDDLVTQAIAELADLVRCRCHPAYRDRKLHDPDCHCDTQGAVQLVTARIKELEAQLADADALIDAQQADHASNNVRYAENAHMAQHAESRLEAKTQQHAAALEAVAKAREEALREAADVADDFVRRLYMATVPYHARGAKAAILALINKGPADGPECLTIPGEERAIIDGLDAKITKLDALCADVAEIVERALKNKAICDEWAWVFEDIQTALTERNNPPDAIIEPHPATNKGDSRE